jgi:serine-type D-Ala-D-Ala carboxypeptidase/endopeptidase
MGFDLDSSINPGLLRRCKRRIEDLSSAPANTKRLFSMGLVFKDVIKRRVDRRVPPGVVFVKIEQGDIEYYSCGYNSLDEMRSPDLDTIFEIGSITKVFTALLFTRLEELGVLSLSDPVGKYLPSSTHIPERDGVSISCEHLLTHTSALPPMPPNFDHTNAMRSFAKYGADDLVAGVENLSLEWPIGQSYVYSNFGYAVLGYVAEKITGERWDDLVKRHICAPLRLENTRTETNARQDNVATAHRGREPVSHFSLGIMRAAGGLKSSSRDMATFLSANLGLIESELASAMKKARTVFYRESPIFALGLGWHIQQRGRQEIVWHRGETSGQTSFVAVDAAARSGIVMLSNSAFSGCCCDLAMAQIDPGTPLIENMPHEIVETTRLKLLKYTGEYRVDSAISFTVTAEENCLAIGVTGQSRGKMFPVGASQFETQDRRVFAIFSEAADALTIRQHGIDRTAFRAN